MQGKRRAGLSLLLLGAALTAILVFRFPGVTTTFTEPSLDGWIAFGALVAGLTLAWWAGIRAAAPRPDDRAGGLSEWAVVWGEFTKSRLAVLGLYLLAALCAATLLAPYLTSFDPTAMPADIAGSRNLSPSLAHLMGTDKFGRDVLTRVLFGARVSLAIGSLAMVISIGLGTVVGAVSGYFGGAVDGILMRLVDTMLSFPKLVLLITVVALFEPSLTIVVLVLGLTLWPSSARIVRGEVLSVREREFIQAARALGLSAPRIIFRHILPNVMGPVIVAATLGIGNIILIEAGLSFLGLSVQSSVPTWGVMIRDGREYMIQAWWVATFPGLAIVFTVVAFNLLGDGLRDALDPRLRT
jgi:peptide/nickel transport system permease protein